MSGRPWIKMPVNRIDDAREGMLSDAAFRDLIQLYRLAGRLDADGHFVENGRQLSDEEIAFKIRVKASRLKSSISEMKKARLVHVNGKGPHILDWQHEQINWREKQESDRQRQARHRSVTRDSEGVTRDGEAVTPPDQIQIRSRSDKRKKRIDPSTPTPPSNGKESGRAGQEGRENKSPKLSFADLKSQSQRRQAEIAMKILRASGLRNPRLKDTSVYLATRIYPTDADLVRDILAALASAYDDPDAKDKCLIAAYRLEHDQIPAHYRKPKTWSSIPREVLEAAKVDPASVSNNKWEIKR